MTHLRKRHRMIDLALFLLAAVAGLPAPAAAQTQTVGAEEEPLFRDYKGVKIGMSADEARQKLGTAEAKSDQQDFYVFSDKETAQVFYDGARKVFAVSINYLGEGSGVPTPKAVLGADIEPKADGSRHRMVRYPKAGYWVSYSRTTGDSPLITVTMQKMAGETP